MSNVLQKAVLLLGSVLALSSAANSVPSAEAPAHSPVAELKARFLACEQLAASDRLDYSEAVDCSLVAETLLKHGFGGNFTQLLQWWKSTRPCHVAGCPDELQVEVERP